MLSHFIRLSQNTKYSITDGQIENDVKRFFALPNIEKFEAFVKRQFSESIYNKMKENTLDIYNDEKKMGIVKSSFQSQKITCIFKKI